MLEKRKSKAGLLIAIPMEAWGLFGADGGGSKALSSI